MNYTDPKTGVRVSTHITQPVEYEAWINGKKVETSSDSMTNEKWWDGEEYAKLYAGQEFCLVHDMDKIVAEAMRRGEVKAWKEALSLMEDEGHRDIIRYKLGSLKTP